ncbi:hypothetical protein FRC20_006556 [Serendipita sp. 405]|nr:hypothetical protein FRC16_006381 [Serendipita sp. 398]KAG8867156.1 hypothetical protein FRC20_006556 [Serendipita sp. 405]
MPYPSLRPISSYVKQWERAKKTLVFFWIGKRVSARYWIKFISTGDLVYQRTSAAGSLKARQVDVPKDMQGIFSIPMLGRATLCRRWHHHKAAQSHMGQLKVKPRL